MSLLLDIWGVLTRRQRRYVVAAQLLSIIMACSTVVGIVSIAPFFSVLGDPRAIEHGAFLHWLASHFGLLSRRDFEIVLGAGFMVLVIAANAINVIGSFLMTRLAWHIGTDLQCALLGEYLGRPFIFHARTQSAVLFHNIINETTRAANDILQNGFLLITNGATAVLIILSMMFLNPAVALAVTAALAGGYALIYIAVRNRLLRAGQAHAHFFIEQTKVVNESLAAIKEILLLHVQPSFIARFKSSNEAVARAAAYTQLVGQSPRHVMECVAVAGLVALALFAGGHEGIGSWLGKLTFLGFAAYRLLPTLNQAFGALVKIRADRAGFSTIVPDLRLARARKGVAIETATSWQKYPNRDITLTEVCFRYEPGRSMAADHVSLRIPAHATVGFVGANGSGKSTMVDLIAGLLVPEAGRITVDGVALDDGNRAAWQSRIAYVPQNTCLLNASIEQNIALGVPAYAVDRRRLLSAVNLAQLDACVASLPGGFGYIVGERGLRLSGGQRQRIGIARALYTNAAVLILDEATNALDGLTEQELLATLARVQGRYTTILVAHQPGTMRTCDMLFEFEHGKIVASGTYAELMHDSVTFRHLVRHPYRDQQPALIN